MTRQQSRVRRTDVVRTGSGASTTTTLYLGGAEKVIAPDGSYTYKRYVSPGVLIEQAHDSSGSRTSEAVRYLLYDHLGSLDVVADAAGTVVQDLSFDAWGQRRAPNDWTTLALLRLADTTHGRYTPRGFTGHEMLDAVGIIHMNGRIYDPKLARFLQADPVIQFPHHAQSYNRYSYVLNNPLAYTDPSGYFIGKLFRKVVGALFNGILGELLFSKVPVLRQFSTLTYCLSGNALLCGTAAAGNAYAGGASLKQSLKAGVFAYVSAQAFTAVGEYFQAAGTAGGLGHLGAHAVTGGVLAELQGGEFGHGFLSAGVAFGVARAGAKQGWSVEAQFVASVVSAGVVSEITGGKFTNGAATAAFSYLVGRAVQSAQAEQTAQTVPGGEVKTTIELRHNRIVPWLLVGPFGPLHAYILVTDHVEGTTKVYRAGPGLNLFTILRKGSFGNINAESATFKKRAPDYTNYPASSLIVLRTDVSASTFNARLSAFVNGINAAPGIQYRLLTQNSNSFAYQALVTIGIHRPARQGFAPGSQTELPH